LKKGNYQKDQRVVLGVIKEDGKVTEKPSEGDSEAPTALESPIKNTADLTPWSPDVGALVWSPDPFAGVTHPTMEGMGTAPDRTTEVKEEPKLVNPMHCRGYDFGAHSIDINQAFSKIKVAPFIVHPHICCSKCSGGQVSDFHRVPVYSDDELVQYYRTGTI
jgi:hypothetical protein